MDLDGVLVVSHSDKQDTAPTCTTSEAVSKRCQDNSAKEMNPTPGKTGWPGPSSSATNTPNRCVR